MNVEPSDWNAGADRRLVFHWLTPDTFTRRLPPSCVVAFQLKYRCRSNQSKVFSAPTGFEYMYLTVRS